jgi:hypothetical protein
LRLYPQGCAHGAGGVMHDFGQVTVDKLILQYGLEDKWQIKPGTHFGSAFKT